MANPVLDFMGVIFNPSTDLVDELNFSGEEKAKGRAGIVQAQSAMAHKMLETEGKPVEHQAS